MSNFWQGTWNSRFSELRFRQNGDRVYGDYGNNGPIEATYNPETKTLDGIFVNNARQGRIRFVLNDTEDAFTGQWAWDNNEPNSAWNGDRRSTDLPTLTTHPAIGTWTTSLGPLKLRQEGTKIYGTLNDTITVDGTFTFSTKTITGTLTSTTTDTFQITIANSAFTGTFQPTIGRTPQPWTGEQTSTTEPDLTPTSDVTPISEPGPFPDPILDPDPIPSQNTPRFQVRVGTWDDPKPLIDALDRANIKLPLSTRDLTDLLSIGGILAQNLTQTEATAIDTALSQATLGDLIIDIEPMSTNIDASPQLQPKFVVRGRIVSESADTTGLTIRAYDRDLRTAQLLGSAITDTNGRYEITYTRNQFRRADKTNADIDLRVYNAAGTLLQFETDTPLPLFNADPDVEIVLILSANAIVTPSEYENLRLLVDPILEGADPASLTPSEIEFIAKDINIANLPQFPFGIDSISLLKASDRLSQSTTIPTAAFYGWGRFGNADWNTREDNLQSIALDPIIDADIDQLERLFTGAIDENWVPQTLRDRWDEIRDRINALKADKDEQIRQTWDIQVASIRLVDETTSTPLPGYTVRATFDGRELPPIELASDITNVDGIASFEYRLPPELVTSNASTPIQFEIFPLQSNGSIADSSISTLTLDYTPKSTAYLETFLPSEVEEEETDSIDPESDSPKPNALSPNAYLADLMRYIINNFESVDGQPLTLSTLEDDLLYQPLEALPRSITAASEPIHQNRIALEILQKYLASNPPSPQQQQRLTQAEREYLQTAYQTLLLRVGTDPDELKRIRYADEEEQDQLASRLGIRRSDLLSGTQPSPLFIEPADLTLERLDSLFGLRSSLSDITPQLLGWQISTLKEQWVDSDFPEDSTNNRFPIIDPDLLTQENFIGDNVALRLFRERTQILQQWFSEAQAQPQTLAGFTALLTTLTLTTDELSSKFEEAQAGASITEYLQGKTILPGEFLYLHNINELFANNTPILASEWQEVYQIVVQFRKRQSFADWIATEKSQISLSPDFFQLTDIDLGDRLDETLELKWRLDLQRSRTWQRTLKARIQQLAALRSQLVEIVDAAESNSLPIWRDGVIAAASLNNETTDNTAERLSEVLLIDLKFSGDQKTTRVSQSLKSLQTLCFATRTGQLDTSVIQLKGEVQTFDTDWQWMGTYETWKAAMAAYLYPENIVLPTIQEHQSPAYRKLVQKVRERTSLSPAYANQLAQEYEDYFRDICNLEVLAACEARVKEEKSIDYIFIFAKDLLSRAYYWSIYYLEASQEEAIYSKWHRLNQDPKNDFIGAGLNGMSPESGRYTHKHACLLFKHRSNDGGNIIQTHQFDLDSKSWQNNSKEDNTEGQANEILLDDFVSSSESFQASVLQFPDENLQIIFQVGLNIYSRKINDEASQFLNDPIPTLYSIVSSRKLLASTNIVYNIADLILIGEPGQKVSAIRYPYNRRLNESNITHIDDLSISTDNFLGISFTDDRNKIHVFENILDDSERIQTRYQTIIFDVGSQQYSLSGVKTLKKAITSIAQVSGKGNFVFYSSRRGVEQQELSLGQFNQIESKFIRLDSYVPSLVEVFDIKPIEARRDIERENNSKFRAIAKNRKSPFNRCYLYEAYLFVILTLAVKLQQSKNYIAALDWYRTIYDYSQPNISQRSFLKGGGLGTFFRILIGRQKPLGLTYSWLTEALKPHDLGLSEYPNISSLFSL